MFPETPTCGYFLNSEMDFFCLKSADIADIFSAHRTRSAAVSKAAPNTDIDTVLKAAGLSNSQTFL